MCILEVSNLTVRYGGIPALRDFSLSMAEGETLFVTGPNGAGKSTLLKAIAGVARPHRGEIRLGGEKIDGGAPERIAHLGFSMVPEGRHVFAGLSVEENLKVAAGRRSDRAAVARDLDEIYGAFPVLAQRRQSPAGHLSGGQQQMLVIGRALMTAPRLIAIDEPSLGLAPKIIDQVYETLLALRERRRLTLLIVEQSSTRAVLAGGRILMLRSGQAVLEGQAGELTPEAMHEAYFGFQAH